MVPNQTDDPPLVVAPEAGVTKVRSCLDCRFAGYVSSVDRRCIRGAVPAEGYPTCLQERLHGECGHAGWNFDAKPVYVPPPPAPSIPYVPRERPAPVQPITRWDPPAKEPNYTYQWRKPQPPKHRNYWEPEDQSAFLMWETWFAALIVGSIVFLAAWCIFNNHTY